MIAMRVHEYKFVEIVSKKVETDYGDFTEMKVADRGSTLAAIRKDNRVVTAIVTKHCLANYVPGLAEATIIVHIPRRTPEDQGLDAAEWMQAFWFACNGGIDGIQRVPVWTQSSIKGCTFYMIEVPVFNRCASAWNLLEDGPKFASYFGLVFSEMDQKTLPLEFDIAAIVDPTHGEDGNCTISSTIWAIAQQFRAMVLNEDGIPIALAKGIVTPIDVRRSRARVQHDSGQVGQGRPLPDAGQQRGVRQDDTRVRVLRADPHAQGQRQGARVPDGARQEGGRGSCVTAHRSSPR